MNLHILPDNKFVETFIEDLLNYNLIENCFCVLVSKSKPAFIPRNHPKILFINKLNEIKNVSEFDKVFLHSFPNRLNNWVVMNKFKSLNWIVWGYDFYNNRYNTFPLYTSSTRSVFKSDENKKPIQFYPKKVLRYIAENKVDNILTWMDTEYSLISNRLLRKPHHQFFYYGQNFLNNALTVPRDKKTIRVLVGNSGFPVLNHIDVFNALNGKDVEMICPVSYGDKNYIEHLKYSYPDVNFIESYLGKEAYVEFLQSCDVAVLNSIRPNGVGNIALLIQLGKPIVLNHESPLSKYLVKKGMKVYSIQELEDVEKIISTNDSSQNLKVYKSIFNEDEKSSIFKRLFL